MIKELTITATVDLTTILSFENMKLESNAVEEEMEDGLDAFKAKIANELKNHLDDGGFDNNIVRDVKVFVREE